MEDAEQARSAAAVIEKAQELERNTGREPHERMTLAEALAVLEDHSEAAPEIATEQIVEVPENPWWRFGVEPYPSEVREYMNELDGWRQDVAHALGTGHPMYRLIDGALRSGDIQELRTAACAISGALSD